MQVKPLFEHRVQAGLLCEQPTRASRQLTHDGRRREEDGGGSGRVASFPNPSAAGQQPK
jgi:hypothetical protein